MFEDCCVIVIFPICDQFVAIWKQGSGGIVYKTYIFINSIVYKTYIFINSNFLSYKNWKSLSQLSHYCFERGIEF